MTAKRVRSDGLGRLLLTIYGLFALAAGARSAVQIATKFGTPRSPTSYRRWPPWSTLSSRSA